MKKRILVLVSFTMGLTGVWSQESIFSLGVGGFGGGDLGGGIETTITPFKMTEPMQYLGGGGFVFFDVKFVEASVGYFMGVGSWEMKTDVPGESNEKLGDFSINSLNIGLLIKYPFEIGDTIKIFPAVGVNYQMVLSAKLDNEEEDYPEDFSSIWFQFGVGLDFNISEIIYLRLEALYGFRPKNKMEERYVDAMNYLFSGYPGVKTEKRLGHGPSIKLALGFNL
jgi:hypothetical protein